VAFTNLTGSNLVGQLERTVSVGGFSSVQAIPEPETYAMMVAGLGLLGFMLRRRTSALKATAPSAAG
jgi:PEP-CTERM motif